MTFTTEIKVGPAGLEALKSQWHQIHAVIATSSVYHDWRWYYVLASRVFKDRIIICLVRDHDKPVALFAFLLNNRRYGFFSYRALELISHPTYIDLTDAVVDPNYFKQPLLQIAVDSLRATMNLRWDICQFEGYAERSFLHQLTQVKQRSVCSGQASAYIVCADESDIGALSTKHLRNIRRLQQKAEQQFGAVSLELIQSGDIDTAFDEFLTIENASWKGQPGNGSSIASGGAEEINFYRDLVDRFMETQHAYLFFLAFGSARVATALALQGGNTLNLIKIGYRQEYAQHGPGNILVKFIIDRMAVNPHIREVNLVTCPEWSLRWHTQVESVYNMTIYSNGPVAQLIKLLRILRQRLTASATKNLGNN